LNLIDVPRAGNICAGIKNHRGYFTASVLEDFGREEFSPLFTKVFAACKRQEYDTFAAIVPRAEYDAYLETL